MWSRLSQLEKRLMALERTSDEAQPLRVLCRRPDESLDEARGRHGLTLDDAGEAPVIYLMSFIPGQGVCEQCQSSDQAPGGYGDAPRGKTRGLEGLL